jgi:hypothetical protein
VFVHLFPGSALALSRRFHEPVGNRLVEICYTSPTGVTLQGIVKVLIGHDGGAAAHDLHGRWVDARPGITREDVDLDAVQ